MSAARTAARRRRQYKLGHKGLAQVFGKKAAPHYPGIMTAAASARKLQRKIETERRIKQGGK